MILVVTFIYGVVGLRREAAPPDRRGRLGVAVCTVLRALDALDYFTYHARSHLLHGLILLPFSAQDSQCRNADHSLGSMAPTEKDCADSERWV